MFCWKNASKSVEMLKHCESRKIQRDKFWIVWKKSKTLKLQIYFLYYYSTIFMALKRKICSISAEPCIAKIICSREIFRPQNKLTVDFNTFLTPLPQLNNILMRLTNSIISSVKVDLQLCTPELEYVIIYQ